MNHHISTLQAANDFNEEMLGMVHGSNDDAPDSPKASSLPDTLRLGEQPLSQGDDDGNEDDEKPNETPPAAESPQPQDANDEQDVAEEPAPKKKRVYLNQLTPNAKEQELERRKQANRDNSKKWHATWVSKGIPKSAGNDEVEAATHDEGPSAGSTDHPEPPQGTIFQPDQELMDMAQSNDMRKVRFKYISKFIESRASGDPTAAAAAQQAWLDSDLRAQMMAAKKKKQY